MHIELYVTAPTDHFLGSRTESWLKILLTHELTHYVHASMDRGFFYALSRCSERTPRARISPSSLDG